MLLITGCGRSGTHFTSEVFKHLGLDLPHEALGRDGTASWKHIVSGTFVYIGKNREKEIDSSGFTSVIHQVRHPLKVIASMQTFSDSTWQHMAKYIKLDPGGPPVVRAMQAWVGWNELVETKADWRFQIERIEEVFPELCRRAGLEPQPFPTVAAESRDSRTVRYKPLVMGDLIKADRGTAGEVETLADRYGYTDLEDYTAPASRGGLLSALKGLFGG